MIKRGEVFTVLICGLLGLSGPSLAADKNQPAGVPEEQAAADKSGQQEVVIRGVHRLKVKAEKQEPDISFDIDEIAVPYVKTEDYVLDVSPTSMAYPAISIVSKLNSTQTASPFIQLFQRPPILTLRPRYNSKVKIAKWRLRITDGFGNVFKDFSGRSALPKKISWDGIGKNSTMVDVGTSYSYIFSIIDVASNPTSQMGKPIVLESLLYEEGGITVAQIVYDVVLEKKGRKTLITKKGELYLREVADLLMAKQNYPLVIESYAKDIDAAKTKGEMIREYFEERLLLSKQKFKISAQKSRIEKVVFKIR